MKVVQIECPHCHYFKVTTHVTTTKGRMRPDTNKFISLSDYKEMMNRIVGIAFVPAIVVAIAVGFLAFSPLRTAFHEPLDNAPMTGITVFLLAILSAGAVGGLVSYLQLGKTAFQKWKRVTQHLSYKECQNCGKIWDYDETYTDGW